MSDPKSEKKQIILPENVIVDYNFEKMLKDFFKKVEKSGVLKEVKARRYYRKSSEIKREEAKQRGRKK